MFSIFKIFKRKKIIPHIRLSGIIGSVGRFKQGINFAGQQEIIDKAFSVKKALAVAISINSPGGSVSSGLAIYDTMQFIKPNVSTMCVGQAASMGALLLAGGQKKKRYCLPHSRVMIHQPLGGFQGQASDIDIHAREILQARERLNKILSEHTGQSLDKIKIDTERDNFMSGNEAQEYGLIDKVLNERVNISES